MQGSGKTTFAEIIAVKNGTYASVSKFAHRPDVDVVIFEDVRADDLEDYSTLYEIAQMRPRFIFTTNTVPVIDPDYRRFHVVHI